MHFSFKVYPLAGTGLYAEKKLTECCKIAALTPVSGSAINEPKHQEPQWPVTVNSKAIKAGSYAAAGLQSIGMQYCVTGE